MKMLFDLIPLLPFLIAYKFYGIFVATAVLMAGSLLQVLSYRLYAKKYDQFQVFLMEDVG
jgi:intracellular septation protein